jgi:hypothetical protein
MLYAVIIGDRRRKDGDGAVRVPVPSAAPWESENRTVLATIEIDASKNEIS